MVSPTAAPPGKVSATPVASGLVLVQGPTRSPPKALTVVRVGEAFKLRQCLCYQRINYQLLGIYNVHLIEPKWLRMNE